MRVVGFNCCEHASGLTGHLQSKHFRLFVRLTKGIARVGIHELEVFCIRVAHEESLVWDFAGAGVLYSASIRRVRSCAAATVSRGNKNAKERNEGAGAVRPQYSKRSAVHLLPRGI